jgi:ATP-dependent Lon protease
MPDEEGLVEAAILPLRGVIIYPQMVSPIFISRKKIRRVIENAQEQNQTLIALVQKDPNEKKPGIGSFFSVGIEIAIGQLVNLSEGAGSALAQGRRRVEVINITEEGSQLRARVRPILESIENDQTAEATVRSVLDMFKHCVQLNRGLPEEAYLHALNIDDPGWLADMIATALSPKMEIRIKLLAMFDPTKRLGYVGELLAQELDMLELGEKIQTRTKKEVDKTQREYYLREQMRVIQGELGEGDPHDEETLEIRERIAQAKLPEHVKQRALKELKRLDHIPSLSPELSIVHSYLDWILDLPWHKTSEDNLNVTHAAKVLERQHYGLTSAKDRILEYIAVKNLRPQGSHQPILCFIGPPGTGKTSIGRSMAESLGREFVRISLGGVRDEAEIRGHRRTYVGALPGRILQKMRRAGTTNPLFMMDEIDKLSFSQRGDPASALLEVLDPEQNYAFSDHYLELDFDLSNVMFVTTANYDDTIPEALLDRMEVIEFPGYIEEEKLEIATRFLIARQIEQNGLDEGDLLFPTESLQLIIREYTYEAGVRNFERELGRICRKIARLKSEKKACPKVIDLKDVERFLGPAQFFHTKAEREDEVGLATGLAWTANGGTIMPVEVLLVVGKGELKLTGQLGSVMQESAQAAFSYLQSRAKMWKIGSERFQDTDIHLHIPTGAIPKDGPSAGITLATALISAFSGRPVRCEVGMTGEVTLRGRVMPVGGVREKILAAYRAGLKTVVIPKENEKDLVDIPEKVRKSIEIISVKHMDEYTTPVL